MSIRLGQLSRLYCNLSAFVHPWTEQRCGTCRGAATLPARRHHTHHITKPQHKVTLSCSGYSGRLIVLLCWTGRRPRGSAGMLTVSPLSTIVPHASPGCQVGLMLFLLAIWVSFELCSSGGSSSPCVGRRMSARREVMDILVMEYASYHSDYSNLLPFSFIFTLVFVANWPIAGTESPFACLAAALKVFMFI